MNKISKKIVALATMAAFVLTLVPAAAFGATVTSESTVNVPEDFREVTLNADAGKTVDVEINVSENIANNGQNVYVWVEKGGDVYSDVTYVKNDKIGFDVTSGKTGDLKWAARLTDPDADNYTVQLTFKNAGEYTVCAGIETAGEGSAMDIDALTQFDVAPYGSNVISVKAANTTVTDISFESASTVEEKTITMAPNSFDVEPVIAYVSGVYEGTEDPAGSVDSKVVSIKNDNESKGVYVYKTGTETTTNEETVKNGQISFDVKVVNGAIAGKYPIYLESDKGEATLYVVVDGNNKATTIEVVDNDSEYVNMEDPVFTGVAEVIFKDAEGNVVNKPATVNKAFVVAPEGFDKTANVANLTLVKVPNTDKYTLKYNGELKAGKYTVRVGIKGQTGNSAVVELTFTAAKVGDPVDLVIDVDNDAETIVSGGTVTGTVYAIDANGIKTPATDAVMGFANSAAVAKGSDVTLTGDAKFTVKAKADEKYYGSKITLIAFDEDAKVQADPVELTVVDGMSTNTLAFDKEAGNIAKNNTVKVSVVDENGKAVAANGQAYAYVESTSNEDAKVDVSFAKGNTVKDGKINMTVYADKETTADIVVAVKDTKTNAIYANTLTYAFGEQDIPVGTTVVMTIGSSDFVINDKVVTKEDSAPYVANDRTYVPFRALGEALGAEVVWDNDARTVTYTLGKTEVVMTIGETTYTVNGDEKTMDVAPEITGDRTYVPVRFVGEALGFKVVALSATDGTTSSVVFQK